MDQPTEMKSVAMKFLANHLYEYRKGVRQMFMMTLTPQEAEPITRRLGEESIDFYVHRVTAAKVNVLFGRTPWVETARRVVNKPLSHLTPEEDFILGTLLGYDKEQQCLRFLGMTRAQPDADAAVA